jgi:hypothetical protein
MSKLTGIETLRKAAGSIMGGVADYDYQSTPKPKKPKQPKPVAAPKVPKQPGMLARLFHRSLDEMAGLQKSVTGAERPGHKYISRKPQAGGGFTYQYTPPAVPRTVSTREVEIGEGTWTSEGPEHPLWKYGLSNNDSMINAVGDVAVNRAQQLFRDRKAGRAPIKERYHGEVGPFSPSSRPAVFGELKGTDWAPGTAAEMYPTPTSDQMRYMTLDEAAQACSDAIVNRGIVQGLWHDSSLAVAQVAPLVKVELSRHHPALWRMRESQKDRIAEAYSVRPAQRALSSKPLEKPVTKSVAGSERPGHKYARRAPKTGGGFKYVYTEGQHYEA